MKKQTKKSSQESKRFGRYEIYNERSEDARGRDIISFREYINNSVLCNLPMINRIYLGEYLDIHNKSDNYFYHIEDTTIRIRENTDGTSSIMIFHKNPTKRQKTRKFLEEILS